MAHVIKYRPARFGAFGRTLAALATVAGFRTAVGIPTSTTDNSVPRFDGTAGALQTSGVTISDTDQVLVRKLYTLGSTTIADDAATSFTVESSVHNGFMAFVVCNGTPLGSGIVSGRVNSSVALASMGGGASFNVVTGGGALTGTTGTDTKFNVSSHTDGKMYLENRLGFSATVSVLVVGI